MTSFPREEPAVSVSSSACAVNEKEPVKNIYLKKDSHYSP